MHLVDSEKIELITTPVVNEFEICWWYDFGKNMIEFCDSQNGIGLAAPQVGVYKRIFVMCTNGVWKVVMNPAILSTSDRKVRGIEGCLSYPGRLFFVDRFDCVHVGYTTKVNHRVEWVEERLDGMDAIVFQHEYDHLFGLTVSLVGREIKSPADGSFNSLGLLAVS